MVSNFGVSKYSTICDILCPCLVVAYTQETLHFLALRMFFWLFYGCTLTLQMFLFTFVLKSAGGKKLSFLVRKLKGCILKWQIGRAHV